jgi:hypothetical protein
MFEHLVQQFPSNPATDVNRGVADPVVVHPGAVEPHILELRIHGVNNTAVTDMLGLPAGDIEQCDGDALGSFWTPTDASLQRGRRAAARLFSGPDGRARAGDWIPPDYVDPDVRREAYSWGAQSRRSGSVPGLDSMWPQRIARAGWLLLAPLGLINLAYWSRRLEPDTVTPATSSPSTAGPHESPSPPPVTRRYGPGRVLILWFGLGMTLLYVATLQAVSLDLVATQCFPVSPTGDGTSPPCAGLPGWLRGLGSLPWTQRMVLLSVVPIAGLLLLWWLSASSRVRYEVPPPATSPPPVGTPKLNGAGPHRRPVLAQPDLWQHWRLATVTARAHLSAGLALVSATLAWSGLWVHDTSCRSLSSVLDPVCRAVAWQHPVYTALILVSVLTLVVPVGLLALPPAPSQESLGALDAASTSGVTGERRRWSQASIESLQRMSGWSTAGTAVLLGLVAAVLATDAQGRRPASSPDLPQVPGLSFVPSVLVTVLLLVALVGLTVRHGRWTVRIAILGVGVVLAGLLAGSHRGWGSGPWPTIVCVAGFAIIGVTVLVRGSSRNHGVEAWWASAPGVFLLLALGLQMMLCGIAVLVAGDWLNGKVPPSCLLPVHETFRATTARADDDCAGALTLPAAYADFMAFVALTGLVVLGVAALMAARWWVGKADPLALDPVPDGEGWPDPKSVDPGLDPRRIRQRAGELAGLLQQSGLRTAVRRARRESDGLQRVESLVGGIAVGLALSLAATVLVLPGRGWTARSLGPWVVLLTTLGLWVSVVAWAGALVKVMTAAGTQARPAGLLWDLLCFLPRTAHPYGPPCYAERAVPEIAGRINAWLTGTDLPRTSHAAERRGVVLAPHSMGAVLAAAALMLEQGRDLRKGHVALLSYGVQLGPYFGRFFPELFGPGPLGTAGVRCAPFRPCAWDAPTGDKTPARERETSGVPAPTLTSVLSVDPRCQEPHLRWISLWRPTDPLGMQVGLKDVDRRAEEIDAAGYLAQVATHGGYPRTVAYRIAFDDLAAAFRSTNDTPAAAEATGLGTRAPAETHDVVVIVTCMSRHSPN